MEADDTIIFLFVWEPDKTYVPAVDIVILLLVTLYPDPEEVKSIVVSDWIRTSKVKVNRIKKLGDFIIFCYLYIFIFLRSEYMIYL